MLQSIAERGRALIDRTRDRRGVAEQRSESLAQLCEDLLSGRGEASGVALAREILSRYGDLKTGSRIAFFEALARRFGPDRSRLSAACGLWKAGQVEVARQQFATLPGQFPERARHIEICLEEMEQWSPPRPKRRATATKKNPRRPRRAAS